MPTLDTPGGQRRRLLLSAAGLLGAMGGLGLPRGASAQPSGARTALVIGNAHYPSAPLANAGNDARLVAATMKNLGFEVTLLLDATHAAMLDALKASLAAGSRAGVRLIYFAGHGAQYRGRNFLIPVDARLRSEDDLPGSALDVGDLSDRLSRFQVGVNVLVLDACRSIPTLSATPGARMRGEGGTLPWTPGLSAATAPRGTLIAYATSPGAVAADNPDARNSIYTRHLVEQLGVPGLTIEEVFKRTRAAVLRDSGGTQLPWETSSLVGDFCFAASPSGGCGIR